jgi:hypothetical protein
MGCVKMSSVNALAISTRGKKYGALAETNEQITTTEPAIDNTAINSEKLVTEGTLLDYMGTPQVTNNGVNEYHVQPKLYGRSHSEISDAGFEFIKAGVIDAEETVATYKLSSQYAGNDVRLATIKATVNYVDTEISAAVQTAISLEQQYNAATYVPLTNYPMTYSINTSMNRSVAKRYSRARH